MKLLKYNCKGLNLLVRPDTSDKKAVDEVIKDSGYKRSKPVSFSVLPDEVWLDLGANIGAFSVWALSLQAKEVHAYEPDPDSFQVLQQNLAGNPRAFAFNKAVTADDKKTATLSQNSANGNVWRNSLHKQWRGGSDVLVICEHIESVLNKFNQPICIKMDIEGSEMDILEFLISRPDLMMKIKKLVFEWSFDIDSNLIRFRNVMKGLSSYFSSVNPSNLYTGYDSWQASWFPPCKTIFCCGIPDQANKELQAKEVVN